MLETIRAFIKKDDKRYVAECLELDALAQGGTLDETVENLRVEVCRCLQHADPAAMGLADDPTMFIILEDVPLVPDRAEC